MGLDNGIKLRIKDKERFGPIPEWFKDLLHVRELNVREFDETVDEFYVLFWRKCYNVRGQIYDVLKGFGKYIGDDLYIDIDTKILEAILKRLCRCYNAEWWKNSYDTIWDWQDELKFDPDVGEWKTEQYGVCDVYWYDVAYAFRVLEFLNTRDPDSYGLFFYDSY